MRIVRAPGKKITAFAAAVICCLAAFDCNAQSPGGRSPSYPIGRRIEQMNRQAEEYERDGFKRDSATKPNSAERKRSKEIEGQVQQDFERIQVIYNELVTAIKARRNLDASFISESAGGINKAAGRLKTNLALPHEKEKNKETPSSVDIDVEQMNASLARLLKNISSFVTNPLFETENVLDVELSTKAGRDLNEIIELSDAIRKKAERLKNSH